MDGATIAMFVFQTVITAIIGVASWGVKNAIGEMKSAITKLEAADKKNAEDIAAVRGELGDLKADLPLIYTTREDFIRVSNNIDQKLDKLLYTMAFFDDMTEQEIRQNKAIRGYIVRALAKGNQNSLLVRQVTNALLADNLITVPDISKQLSYLEDGGYIEFTDKRATAYNAYRRDAVIQLTKAGVDLVEGTREDPGVDV